MTLRFISTHDALLGAGYFLLAVLSILTTRFDSSVAFLWLATPLLIAALLTRPRRRWWGPVLCCMLGSIAASGLVGVGWLLSLPMAFGNVGEALSTGFLLRMLRSSSAPFGSVRWYFQLGLAGGLAGPLTMAMIVAGPLHILDDIDLWTTVSRLMVGHGLSNLAFVPIFKLFATGRSERWNWRTDRKEVVETFALFALQIAVSVAAFAQGFLPLLFLPILPVVVIAAQCGSRRTAVALLLLAAIGGSFTLSGHGPANFGDRWSGVEMQFFTMYLFCTALTVVPISVRLRMRRRMGTRLSVSEARYRMLADHSSDIIMHTDRTGKLLFVSPSIRRIGLYDPPRLVGSDLMALVDEQHRETVRAGFGRALECPGNIPGFEFRARTREGQWLWFECFCRGVAGEDGKIGSVVSVARDISDRKVREEQLASAAMTDPLTGLANRRSFRAVAENSSGPGSTGGGALALLDIDHFKTVNDRFGHDVGDEVLRAFARVAREHLRNDDVFARIGGEEFAIFFPGLDEVQAGQACERIRKAVAEASWDTSGGPVRITISGGVTALGSGDLDSALKRADVALYHAKAQGRDRLQLAA